MIVCKIDSKEKEFLLQKLGTTDDGLFAFDNGVWGILIWDEKHNLLSLHFADDIISWDDDPPETPPAEQRPRLFLVPKNQKNDDPVPRGSSEKP